MDKMRAAFNVNSASELAEVWSALLKPDMRKRSLHACHEYFATLGGAAEKTWAEIEAYMLDRKKSE